MTKPFPISNAQLKEIEATAQQDLEKIRFTIDMVISGLLNSDFDPGLIAAALAMATGEVAAEAQVDNEIAVEEGEATAVTITEQETRAAMVRYFDQAFAETVAEIREEDREIREAFEELGSDDDEPPARRMLRRNTH